MAATSVTAAPISLGHHPSTCRYPTASSAADDACWPRRGSSTDAIDRRRLGRARYDRPHHDLEAEIRSRPRTTRRPAPRTDPAGRPAASPSPTGATSDVPSRSGRSLHLSLKRVRLSEDVLQYSVVLLPLCGAVVGWMVGRGAVAVDGGAPSSIPRRPDSPPTDRRSGRGGDDRGGDPHLPRRGLRHHAGRGAAGREPVLAADRPPVRRSRLTQVTLASSWPRSCTADHGAGGDRVRRRPDRAHHRPWPSCSCSSWRRCSSSSPSCTASSGCCGCSTSCASRPGRPTARSMTPSRRARIPEVTAWPTTRAAPCAAVGCPATASDRPHPAGHRPRRPRRPRRDPRMLGRGRGRRQPRRTGPRPSPDPRACQGRLTDDLVLGCFAVRHRAHAAAAPGFGFRQLVDTSSRALSPAINDPTTGGAGAPPCRRPARADRLTARSDGLVRDGAARRSGQDLAADFADLVRFGFTEITRCTRPTCRRWLAPCSPCATSSSRLRAAPQAAVSSSSVAASSKRSTPRNRGAVPVDQPGTG